MPIELCPENREDGSLKYQSQNTGLYKKSEAQALADLKEVTYEEIKDVLSADIEILKQEQTFHVKL